MARRTKFGGRPAILEGLRVELIPFDDDASNAEARRQRIQKILTLMYDGLRQRGRPSNRQAPGDLNAA